MTSRQEKKNEQVAFLASVGIHAVVLLAMFFIVAWRTPDPPYGGEPGVELNFGLDTEGGGDVQPQTPVGSGGTQPEEPQRNEIPQATPPPAAPKEQVEEKMVTSEEDDAPAIAKEEKKETKRPVETPPVKQPTETKKPEARKEEQKPKEEVNPNAVYNPAGQANSTNKTTEGRAGSPGSHGDDKGKTGDKGNPEGSLDAKALYGKQGNGNGGDGSSLSLDGWVWDAIPRPTVPNNESGRIVFDIVVNAEGELEKITVSENTLSPEGAKACRAAVENLTFSRTGANVPQASRGKITFVVRSR
jgi:outer membrane biosynthesis protein TonB